MAPSSAPRARRSRRGHTMAELMLVLAILVLFAGIAMPKLANAMFRSRLDAAFSAARTDLHYARDRAVGTGLRHQLALDPTSHEIVVQAYHPEEATGAGAAATSGGNNVQADVPLRDKLPDDVRVATWNIAPLGSDPSRPTVQFSAQSGVTPLVFYPEGSCDTATLILEDNAGHRRGLRVEGFTGEVRELTEEELK